MGQVFDESLRMQFTVRLHELTVEHRDLDDAIHRIANDPVHDQLALRRMKRRKLLLKDQMAWIRRQLDPDVPA